VFWWALNFLGCSSPAPENAKVTLYPALKMWTNDADHARWQMEALADWDVYTWEQVSYTREATFADVKPGGRYDHYGVPPSLPARVFGECRRNLLAIILRRGCWDENGQWDDRGQNAYLLNPLSGVQTSEEAMETLSRTRY
jgi:hypothetical protein